MLGVRLFRWRAAKRVVDLAVVAALELASVTGEDLPWFRAHPGVPGSIIYPVTRAVGLFIVLGAGVRLFDERLGPFGAL